MHKHAMNLDFHNFLSTPNSVKFTESGYPILNPIQELPSYFEIMGFNFAMSSKEYDKFIHYFVDDYQMNRVWNKPEQYATLIKNFAGAFTPDFSLYRNLPLPLQMYNHYRKQWCGAYWQSMGIQVIPTIGWSDERSYDFCFEGIPKNAIVTTSTVGSLKDSIAKEYFIKGWNKMLEVLKPKLILLYGSKKMAESLEGNVKYLLNIEFE